MRKRYITVFKNPNGVNEYDTGVEESSNFESYELTEEEFEHLTSEQIWNRLNQDHNLLIDDYESEMIPVDILERCKEMIEPIKADVMCFSRAINEALKYRTPIALDF